MYLTLSVVVKVTFLVDSNVKYYKIKDLFFHVIKVFFVCHSRHVLCCIISPIPNFFHFSGKKEEEEEKHLLNISRKSLGKSGMWNKKCFLFAEFQSYILLMKQKNPHFWGRCIFPEECRWSILWGAVANQVGNTSSRTITEVKQRCARWVLGWETPVQVLPECCRYPLKSARFD